MCRPVINLLCGSNSAGCQVISFFLTKLTSHKDFPEGQASLGSFDTLAFSYDTQVSGGKGLIATYTNGDVVVAINNTRARSLVVEFKCDGTY